MAAKKLIVEEDVLRAVRDGTFCIQVQGDALVTPLAESSMKEKGVRLVQPGEQGRNTEPVARLDAAAYEEKLRQEICEAGRRLKSAGFMAGSDGNISALLNEREVLITPSRLSKGHIKPEDIIKVDRKGNKLCGDHPPSIERFMHLAAFEERPDICSVVHAHPPYLVAFTAAGLTLPAMITPETELFFGGEIAVAPYAAPGSVALADVIRKPIRKANLILLDHHGALAVGQDVLSTAMLIEHAESSAQVIFYARALGGEKPLPSESIAQLREAYHRMAESQPYSGSCHAFRQENGSACNTCDLEEAVRKIIEGVDEKRNANAE